MGFLKEQLNDSCLDEINEIERKVKKIWSNPLLPWFTDHGLSHSEQIISNANQIISYLSKHNNFSLNEDEIFIFLASAYLHDIGMQYLNVDEISIEDLTDNEYEKIRKKHALKTEELILKRKFPVPDDKSMSYSLGLDSLNRGYIQAISTLCSGHSSTNYKDVYNKIKQNPLIVNNKKIKGDLLLGLLLICDELDISMIRTDERKFSTFNPSSYSYMHHFKHLYVKYIGINGPKIEIVYEFPEKFSSFAVYLYTIVQDKIKIELKRFNSVLEDRNLPKFDNEIQRSTQFNELLPFPDKEVLKKFKKECEKFEGPTLKNKVQNPAYSPSDDPSYLYRLDLNENDINSINCEFEYISNFSQEKLLTHKTITDLKLYLLDNSDDISTRIKLAWGYIKLNKKTEALEELYILDKKHGDYRAKILQKMINNNEIELLASLNTLEFVTCAYIDHDLPEEIELKIIILDKKNKNNKKVINYKSNGVILPEGDYSNKQANILLKNAEEGKEYILNSFSIMQTLLNKNSKPIIDYGNVLLEYNNIKL
ncbi:MULTISPECIES: hypothetical protein [unclassified Halanaerobium]|uniref:HD domain-containing protein n=1 Tax=unclassified Halanaerobium TaxID=2641197 RepID=UPI000DF143C6|nr:MULTISPECIES: hypothetical protein [unclassified Halanaerobium]RCW48188.1 hypothetical protein DFR78_11043 [Halanaerobium sp. MA284_MarDTE_T2]RCW81638.1 hypothetical protein DER71_1233 [Halanaerobium sp. DL-01]